MRGRINSAQVLALIAIVLAVGGNAVAFTLGKNSVGTKQLKKNAVTKVKIRRNAVDGRRVKNNSLTGADIKLSKLGTVPSARNAAAAGTANTANVANTANTANVASIASSLAPVEGWHVVGAPGEPGFQNGWSNDEAPLYTNAAFYKDHEGVVHLRGAVSGGIGQIFQLPPGYRPAPDKEHIVPIICTGGACSADNLGTGAVFGPSSESPEVSGAVIGTGVSNVLEGISFRAES